MWEFAILEHRRCFNLLPHSMAFSIQSPRRTAKSVKMFFGSQIKLCTQSKLAIVILYVLIIYHHSSPVLTSCCGRVAANPQTQSKDSKWPSFANHLQDKFIDFGQLEFFDKAKQFAERQQKRNNMKQICQAYCMLNPLKRRPFEQLKCTLPF